MSVEDILLLIWVVACCGTPIFAILLLLGSFLRYELSGRARYDRCLVSIDRLERDLGLKQG